mmetsp:Transcript_7191/g.21267  ORF Transcript_7191/g.21267 Transcript_7191/m.21267 type:complete len:213 (+) Transcript_7191:2220-2858(+)
MASLPSPSLSVQARRHLSCVAPEDVCTPHSNFMTSMEVARTSLRCSSSRSSSGRPATMSRSNFASAAWRPSLSLDSICSMGRLNLFCIASFIPSDERMISRISSSLGSSSSGVSQAGSRGSRSTEASTSPLMSKRGSSSSSLPHSETTMSDFSRRLTRQTFTSRDGITLRAASRKGTETKPCSLPFLAHFLCTRWPGKRPWRCSRRLITGNS